MSLFRLVSSFNKQEIQTLFKTARTKINAHGLTIKVAPKQSDYGRILIVTPRKVGNAVKRNLIRRRLKSIFYEEKLYTGPYDCLIFVSQEAIKVPFSLIKETIVKALTHENS